MASTKGERDKVEACKSKVRKAINKPKNVEEQERMGIFEAVTRAVSLYDTEQASRDRMAKSIQ